MQDYCGGELTKNVIWLSRRTDGQTDRQTDRQQRRDDKLPMSFTRVVLFLARTSITANNNTQMLDRFVLWRALS